jgi:hypothetical protein
MTSIDLSQFRLVIPCQDKLTAMALNVMLDGSIHLNGKLMENVNSPNIFLRVNKDGRQILIEALQEQQDNALRLPKSGSIKRTDLSRELVASGLKLPVHYSVIWNEDIRMWHGTYCPEQTPILIKLCNKKKKISQPRKDGLQDMMPLSGGGYYG